MTFTESHTSPTVAARLSAAGWVAVNATDWRSPVTGHSHCWCVALKEADLPRVIHTAEAHGPIGQKNMKGVKKKACAPKWVKAN